MQEIDIRCDNHASNFAKSLVEASTNDFCADAKFITSDGMEFPVQTQLLAACSSFMIDLISSLPPSVHTPVILFPDYSGRTMEVFLQYLYIGCVKGNRDDCIQVCDLMKQVEMQTPISFGFDATVAATDSYDDQLQIIDEDGILHPHAVDEAKLFLPGGSTHTKMKCPPKASSSVLSFPAAANGSSNDSMTDLNDLSRPPRRRSKDANDILKCMFCGLRFRDVENLSDHIQRSHKDTTHCETSFSSVKKKKKKTLIGGGNGHQRRATVSGMSTLEPRSKKPCPLSVKLHQRKSSSSMKIEPDTAVESIDADAPTVIENSSGGGIREEADVTDGVGLLSGAVEIIMEPKLEFDPLDTNDGNEQGTPTSAAVATYYATQQRKTTIKSKKPKKKAKLASGVNGGGIMNKLKVKPKPKVNAKTESPKSKTSPIRKEALEKKQKPEPDPISGKFLCSICDLTFTNHTSLLFHHEVHTGERKFKCEYCHRGYKVKSILIDHTIIAHTKDYPHRCTQCNKGFTRPSALNKHNCVALSTE